MKHTRDTTITRRAFVGRVAAGTTATALSGLLPGASALAAAQITGSGAHVESGPVISGVHLRGRTGLWNVGIKDGRIERITQAALPGSNVIFGNGRLLTEGLVEHHIHLDKTLTADRLRWDEASLAADRARYDEEFKSGRFIRFFTIYRESLIKDTFTEDDVFERSVRMAKIALTNGTTAIRTHAVVEEVRGLNCVTGLLRAREAMRPFMDIQIVLHPQDGNMLRQPKVIELMHEAMKLGADGVGGLPELDWDHATDYIDLVFRIAADHGGFVDMHVDQGSALRTNPKIFSHPIIVAKTREYGLQGRVTASHSFSLGTQPQSAVLPVLDQMRENGIHLACSSSGSLEERIQIPRSRGVLVSLINDNVRDPLQRGGNADLIEVARTYRRGLGLISDEALDATFDLITTCPGKALGLDGYGLQEGGRADLVLFDADSPADVLMYGAAPALVFKAGRVVAQDRRFL